MNSAAGGPSRRAFLLTGAAAVLAGGGAGVGVAFTRSQPRPPAPPRPPATLVAALDAERALLAGIDASLRATPALRPMLAGVRSDHAAHADALAEVIAASGATPPAPAPAPEPPTTAGEPPGTARSKAQLRAAEQAAATAGASRAATLHGPVAALLASIAACEATHAELLR